MPLFPTAMESGREPTKSSLSARCVFKLMTLMLKEPRFAAYSELPSGLSARLAGCSPVRMLPASRPVLTEKISTWFRVGFAR